jgi:hypothetical protein
MSAFECQKPNEISIQQKSVNKMLQIGGLQKTLRNGAYKKVRIVLKGDMHKEMFSDAVSI